MKTLKIFLWILCFLILLFGLFGRGIIGCGSEAATKTSQAFLDTIIPSVCDDWNLRFLEKNATPEMKGDIEKNKSSFLSFFSLCRSRLGHLKKFKTSHCDMNFYPFQFNVFGRKTGLPDGKAKYILDADFANGKATLTIGLELVKKQWFVSSFWVTSKLFKVS